jgi:hypothetical protein
MLCKALEIEIERRESVFRGLVMQSTRTHLCSWDLRSTSPHEQPESEGICRGRNDRLDVAPYR